MYDRLRPFVAAGFSPRPDVVISQSIKPTDDDGYQPPGLTASAEADGYRRRPQQGAATTGGSLTFSHHSSTLNAEIYGGKQCYF
jgi:hypothetical protein